MVDRLEPGKRSWNMSRVRSAHTRPELAVRRLLHGLGYRFRLHVRGLPGKPDLVFPGRKAVIFVHGCFWHRHAGCARASMPSTRPEFWREKFETNRRRDMLVMTSLRGEGWRVHVVWECEIKDRLTLLERLQAFLGPPGNGKKPQCWAVTSTDSDICSVPTINLC
ncbi:very short patch repair endonuclease [Azospirillum sp. ST 5-10]|uniref:very short patch repair endonuclease n=1 Tax=unclassified Azospirillum TaxID=2630922 RepID=UPI003F49F302